MSNLSPTDALDDIKAWFVHLRAFRSACVGTNAMDMNLLTFANAAITSVLPTSAEQNNFIVSAVDATGYNDMALSDLSTTYKTFEALLDHWNPLITPIALYLWSLSIPSLQGGASADFWKALISTAFPGGSKGVAWTGVMNGLASAFAPECFTGTFQTKVNAAVDAAGTKISDLVPQIAGLG
jgi:hypothetical protein